MQFLTESQALGALRRGVTIEQARLEGDGDGTLSWLTAQRVGDHISLRMHVVHDEGTDDFWDVTELSPVDQDEPHGEGAELGSFSSEEEFLAAAAAAGAAAHRWLNAGMVEDLYGERRRLIKLVERIQTGAYTDDAELKSLVADFCSSVPRPDAHGLIFWPNGEFSGEPTASQVVDRALAYRSIEL
ncbi:hypothetical protein [Nocardioides sp. SYSU DS0651]|uniref:hypothetical protein n=1 Tax=Nocardioides sp. SYSU DS0651 TaxID=3415955 RepID=UPI003F4BE2C4